MQEQDWGLISSTDEGVYYISDETWVISNGFTGGQQEKLCGFEGVVATGRSSVFRLVGVVFVLPVGSSQPRAYCDSVGLIGLVFALGKRLIFSRYEALINPNTKTNELMHKW